MFAQSRSGNQNKKNVGRNPRAMTSRGPALVLPALAALGIGHPASALELGPARVHSALGQPLRASIAFALRPFEQIAPYCIRVTPGRSASGLPSAGDAWVTLRDGAIQISGEAAVSEPLLALQLTVDCPYAPHLSREYVVFVDPEQPAAAATPQAAHDAVQVRPAPASVAAPAVHKALPAPIAASTTYRVERGDTLSGIAERLSGRRVGLWQAAELLFAANPGAFMNNDPDRLRAGALLAIPDALYAAELSGVAAPAAPAREAPVAPSEASTAYAGYVPKTPTEPRPAASVPDGLFLDPAGEAQAARTTPRDAGSAAPAAGQPESSPAATAPSPRPGDVLVDADGLFVSPIEIEGESGEPAGAGIFVEPAADGAQTVAPAARVTAGEPAKSGWSWLVWLAGTGVTLILGLLVFGRKLASRPARRTLPSRDALVRHEVEDAPEKGAPLEAPKMDVDFAFDDADADARIVRLDVDLDDGTGFKETGDLDVAQDFGFSASGGLELGLDVDFSDETPAMLDASGRRREGEVIVEQEIPPGESATSEYDLSMIVDATRQPLGDSDDTEKDLHAIELDITDTSQEEDPFTLSSEVDYKILEQDYEDELTATQALSAELADAARDLVERIYEEPGDTTLHELPTVEMPAPAAEPTAELPRVGGKEPGASQTVEMLPVSAMAGQGDTDVNEDLATLPEAGNDASAGMEIESATIDTKKLRAS